MEQSELLRSSWPARRSHSDKPTGIKTNKLIIHFPILVDYVWTMQQYFCFISLSHKWIMEIFSIAQFRVFWIPTLGKSDISYERLRTVPPSLLWIKKNIVILIWVFFFDDAGWLFVQVSQHNMYYLTLRVVFFEWSSTIL